MDLKKQTDKNNETIANVSPKLQGLDIRLKMIATILTSILTHFEFVGKSLPQRFTVRSKFSLTAVTAFCFPTFWQGK
jgi:hypothetical protein